MAQTRNVYDPVAQTFHWSVAAAILVMFLLAGLMDYDGWTGEMRRTLYTSHKTLGVLILLATFCRLGWRLKNPPPPLPAGINKFEALAAHLVHFGLYLMCFLIPLAGWAMVSAGPYGIQLFGVIPFPNLPVHSLTDILPDPRPFFAEGHEMLAGFILLLLVLHIAGALKHHFIDRNGLILRMLPAWMKK